jgi:hypothetical protein
MPASNAVITTSSTRYMQSAEAARKNQKLTKVSGACFWEERENILINEGKEQSPNESVEENARWHANDVKITISPNNPPWMPSLLEILLFTSKLDQTSEPAFNSESASLDLWATTISKPSRKALPCRKFEQELAVWLTDFHG